MKIEDLISEQAALAQLPTAASKAGKVIQGVFSKPAARPGSSSAPATAGQQGSNVTPIKPGGSTQPQTAGGGRQPAANEPAAGTVSQPNFVPAGQQAQPVPLTGRPTAPGASSTPGGNVQQPALSAPAPAPTKPNITGPATAAGAVAAGVGISAMNASQQPNTATQSDSDDLGQAAPAPASPPASTAAPAAAPASATSGDEAIQAADDAELARMKQLAGSTQADKDEGEAAARAAQAQADTVDRADAEMGAAMRANAQPKPAQEPAPATGAAQPAKQPEPAAAQATAPAGAKTPPTDAKPIAAPVPPPSQATVKSGTTLSQIAKDNNTTVADMMKANPELKNPDAIRAGMKLNIPTGGTSTNPYAGGVGTAADTAKKVASGEFASYQDALKAIPRGDVDKPVAPGSVQTRAGTWKAGEKGTIDAPVLSRGATTTQGSTGTTPPAPSTTRSDAEARSAAMRDQQALGGQGGDTPVTAPRAQSDKDLADIRKLAGTDDARTTEVPPIDKPLSTPPGAEPESSRRRAETGLKEPPQPAQSKTVSKPEPVGASTRPDVQAAAQAGNAASGDNLIPKNSSTPLPGGSSALPPEAGQTTTTTRSLSNRSDSSQPYQPGLDRARANMDRDIARMKAQRDASPEWQNAPSTTTTNPDGTVTTTRSASWTVPPNPNAGKPAKDNAPPEIARRDFEEDIQSILKLSGLIEGDVVDFEKYKNKLPKEVPSTPTDTAGKMDKIKDVIPQPAKSVGSAAAKLIGPAATALSAYDAAERYKAGDNVGAGLSAAQAALAMTPAWPATIPLAAYQYYRDNPDAKIDIPQGTFSLNKSMKETDKAQKGNWRDMQQKLNQIEAKYRPKK